MTTTNPITPPPELRQLWAQQAQRMNPRDPIAWQEHIANQAAQWGADQELEAMMARIEELPFPSGYADALRAACRPNPPSLKEQALHELNDVYSRDKIDDSTYDTIRRALEALPE
jgi:hypothetical protein